MSKRNYEIIVQKDFTKGDNWDYGKGQTPYSRIFLMSYLPIARYYDLNGNLMPIDSFDFPTTEGVNEAIEKMMRRNGLQRKDVKITRK